MSAFKTLTLGDLKELCDDLIRQGYGEETLITTASNYGDFHRTQQVHTLNENVELLPIEKSAYSNSGWAVATDDEDEEDEERPHVLVISWRR